MRNTFLIFSTCLICFGLTGCGVTFRDRDINLKLSPEMLGRSVFADTEILKRHLEEVPGYVVVDDGSGALQVVGNIVPQGFTPTVNPINDKQAFYHSVIDQSAGLQGSYLKVLSADLSTKQTADVSISETAECFIPKTSVPWLSIAQWAKAHPPASGTKRYFIQGALLSAVSKTVYVEISSNASVDGGAAYGASGKVYATDKDTQTSNFAFIGTHLLDVDLISANPPDNMAIQGMKDFDNPYLVQQGAIFTKVAFGLQ
jgi:hypothetical protein